jgi:hypothetical protein
VLNLETVLAGTTRRYPGTTCIHTFLARTNTLSLIICTFAGYLFESGTPKKNNIMSKACFVETPKDELGTLLKKLRPFQREGFDFATRSLKNNNGAGRILLADEMVRR